MRYVLDDEPRYVDLTYRDQDTPVVVYDEDWQNNRQRAVVSVLKKEKDSDRVLEGAIFGLYTKEDILSASGKVLIEADTIIELKSTDAEGKITFVAELPVDGKYYVKEIYAPAGFVTTDEIKEFTFEYQGEDTAEVSYAFTFEDEPTTVEITKSDLTTGKELPGAKLQVIDESGKIVDEWVSEKEPHVIKELAVGKTYTLVETKPADGYVTAESVAFTIENTAKIQKVEMKDDVTKVEISKTDITGKKELPGAKLTILDSDGNVVETWVSTGEPHYIEKREPALWQAPSHTWLLTIFAFLPSSAHRKASQSGCGQNHEKKRKPEVRIISGFRYIGRFRFILHNHFLDFRRIFYFKSNILSHQVTIRGLLLAQCVSANRQFLEKF